MDAMHTTTDSREGSTTMRLMYVFDYRETAGYVCRVPEFLARVIVKRGRFLDYAPTLKGL